MFKNVCAFHVLPLCDKMWPFFDRVIWSVWSVWVAVLMCVLWSCVPCLLPPHGLEAIGVEILEVRAVLACMRDTPRGEPGRSGPAHSLAIVPVPGGFAPPSQPGAYSRSLPTPRPSSNSQAWESQSQSQSFENLDDVEEECDHQPSVAEQLDALLGPKNKDPVV